MKRVITALILVAISAGAVTPAFAGKVKSIELTKDNPKSLVGTKSTDFTIYGLRIGLTRNEVKQILDKSKSIMVEGFPEDVDNLEVYGRSADMSKRKSLFSLIWHSGESKVSEIVMHSGSNDSIQPNFRRLLTTDALVSNSVFMKQFVGKASRPALTEIIPPIGDFPSLGKNITYYYDDIGLHIYHIQFSGTPDSIKFILVKPHT